MFSTGEKGECGETESYPAEVPFRPHLIHLVRLVHLPGEVLSGTCRRERNARRPQFRGCFVDSIHRETH